MAQAYFWQRDIECMPRPDLERLQAERLRAVVAMAMQRVPLYRKRLREAGIKADDISDVSDLRRLPFTTKDDLRDTYPFGMFAVPMEQVVRIHASSGTTGKQTVVGYTRGDIGVWAEVIARTLGAGGATAGDVVHNAYGYGLFTGGLGLHYGGEAIGAAVIPVSGGQTKRQVQIMQDFGSTVLCCTPSYALVVAETAATMGVDLAQLSLRVGFFGAEPWTEGMRAEIEEKLAIDALDIYGLSEMIGPGVAYECLEKAGLHIAEDHFLPEVINPDTGEAVGAGEQGELVFTTLTKEALPLIRYRTRDLTVLDDAPCACGRTCRRMRRVTGRSDDMLIIRGVNVFPSQIESVIVGMEGVAPHYLLVVDRKPGKMDELEVWVEVSENVFSDAAPDAVGAGLPTGPRAGTEPRPHEVREGGSTSEMKQLEQLQQRVLREIESVLGLSVAVKLVEPRSIARSEGKAKRVIDRRELFK